MSSQDFVRDGEQRMAARLADIDAARAKALRLQTLHDAAPQLVEALEICRAVIANPMSLTRAVQERAMAAADAALAKARGDAA